MKSWLKGVEQALDTDDTDDTDYTDVSVSEDNLLSEQHSCI